MNLQLQEAIVDEFKAVLVSDDSKQEFEINLNILQKALQHGVLIAPQCFTGEDKVGVDKLVDYIIGKYGVNANKVNSTFYKRFSDVESRSELQLRVEQLLHYMSTYGSGYEGTNGHIYEPEFLKDIDLDVNHQLTYIDAITKEELTLKIKNMLTSGIALNELTQVHLLMIIKALQLKIDYVDQINNREFMCRLCKELGLLPESFDEFTRYLIYLATGSTLLIKSRGMYNRLSEDGIDKLALQHAFNQYVNTFGVEQVAKNITRYRKLYLLIRKNLLNKKDLNKALKLSKKLYVPRKQSPLEHVLDPKLSMDEIENAVKRAPIYKLVKVYNYVDRSMESEQARYFKIRNGKSFLKISDDNKPAGLIKTMTKIEIKQLIVNEIKHRLGSWKDKVFVMPKNVDYAVPTSAKDFVGSLPYMSKYHIVSKKLSFGVAWEQQADLDLHATTLDGGYLGWDGSFTDDGITFSGDMTQLNEYGYAAEFLSLDPKKLKQPVIVSVQQFSSLDELTKFDVFATGSPVKTDIKQGVATQIDSDSVLFHDEVSNDNLSETLAVIIPTEDGGCDVVYTAVKYGNVRVPGVDSTTEKLVEVLENQANNTLMFSELIKLLGGTIVSSHDEFKEVLVNGKRVMTQVVNDGNNQRYVALNYKAPECVNLQPDKVTASTFIDLLKEPEEKK